MFFSRPKSILGIDIGTSYIKAVQIKQEKDRAELESYGMVHVVYPEKLEPGFDVLAETSKILQSLHEKSQFTSKKVVLSIPSNVAFVSIFTLPAMPEQEMQKSIEYKATSYVPMPLSDVNLSWQVLSERPIMAAAEPAAPTATSALTKPLSLKLGKNKPKEEKEMEILITAVAKNVVNNYLNIVTQAGFEPVALEVESLSQIRALVDPRAREDLLIVDVGAKATNLNLVHNGFLSGTRHLGVGGDTITANLAHSFGVSFERAEQMKKSPADPSAINPVSQIAKPVVEAVVLESQQLIRIMTNQGKSISQIILTGGGSKFPGFEKELSELGYPIVLGEPLQKVSFDPSLEAALRPLSQQLAVAFGLALRTVN